MFKDLGRERDPSARCPSFLGVNTRSGRPSWSDGRFGFVCPLACLTRVYLSSGGLSGGPFLRRLPSSLPAIATEVRIPQVTTDCQGLIWPILGWILAEVAPI